VASTGRCGTNTLYAIFANHPSVSSFHEPYPIVLSNNSEISKLDSDMLSIQKRKILTILRNAKTPIYFESNHMFVKNFIEEIFTYIPKQQIKVLHLSRDAVKVATSFYSIGSIPGKTKRGKKYLLEPAATNNQIKLPELLENGEFQHDFYKCLWYWYEIEARVRFYKKKFHQYFWFDVSTNNLNNEDAIMKLAQYIGLDISQFSRQLNIGKKYNLKLAEKKDTSDIEVDEMHTKFRSLLDSHGYLSFPEPK
tara:strand:+ start:953 stop:1705 length:753 start_codon:yes stop_codon:yes gene_type:complete